MLKTHWKRIDRDKVSASMNWCGSQNYGNILRLAWQQGLYIVNSTGSMAVEERAGFEELFIYLGSHWGLGQVLLELSLSAEQWAAVNQHLGKDSSRLGL